MLKIKENATTSNFAYNTYVINSAHISEPLAIQTEQFSNFAYNTYVINSAHISEPLAIQTEQ